MIDFIIQKQTTKEIIMSAICDNCLEILYCNIDDIYTSNVYWYAHEDNNKTFCKTCSQNLFGKLSKSNLDKNKIIPIREAVNKIGIDKHIEYNPNKRKTNIIYTSNEQCYYAKYFDD